MKQQLNGQVVYGDKETVIRQYDSHLVTIII